MAAVEAGGVAVFRSCKGMGVSDSGGVIGHVPQRAPLRGLAAGSLPFPIVTVGSELITAAATMATPPSSATSPSPPMPYRNPTVAPPQVPPSAPADHADREQRKIAVQKLLARAEVANVSLLP